MCFSASASFSASAALLVIGGLTLRHARTRAEWPLAGIALVFAIQQASEGVVWLTFSHAAPLLNSVMTHVFEFLSHVLWPIYVPLAVLLIEPSRWHRRAIGALVVAGVAVGVYLLYIMFAYPVVARHSGHHIEYVSPHFHVLLTMALYLCATTLSPMFSSQRWVQVFGVASLLAFIATYALYTTWFISVWCFFAALLSVLIYLHFASRERGRPRRLNVTPSETGVT